MWLSDGRKVLNKFIIVSNKNDKIGNYDKSITQSRPYSFDVSVERDLGGGGTRRACIVSLLSLLKVGLVTQETAISSAGRSA